jgi:glutaredoxin-like YruB-family protein
MTGQEILSHEELITNIKGKKRAFLLLYKKGSEQSECSLKNLAQVDKKDADVDIYMADVSAVRDIHTQYNVTSVPTMLEFENGKFLNVLKGCHEPGFYKSFFDNAVYAAKLSAEGEKQQKRVTVYSTPTCSWCTTLKTHLKKNGIRYSEIDVSKDQNAAQEMQRRSGQMGVPQTDIAGEMIVGFDKTRINSLLGIS